MQVDAIEFDSEELEAASSWHSGQTCMLYAIASTGTLKRGTRRPMHPDEDRPMTDAEWFADLCERLQSDAEESADMAQKRAEDIESGNIEPDSEDELDELLSHVDALHSIARKCETALKGGNPNI